MSQEQIKRYMVIHKSQEGQISVKDAATALNLSERQVIRLRKGVSINGAQALIHKNQGRPPAHKTTEELRKAIISHKSSDNYKDSNFKHFQELLAKHEKIEVSYSLIHRLLTEAGIPSPKKRRRFKPHRRRNRKSQEGLLIQIDATPFEWFGDDQAYALHGAIDDATGKIVGLYITKHECLQGYFEIIRQMLINQGIPVSIYSDRHSIFLSTKKGKLTIEEELAGKVCNDTQFGRAMKELGITMIYARSAPAKGRVERLWGTLQSRLPVEFQIAGVKNIDEANKFLKGYINEFNQLFAVEPQNTESAFRPLSAIDINSILCVKQKRKVDAGGVFSFYGKCFKVTTEENLPPIPTHSQITIFVSSITGVGVEYNGKIYGTVPFIKPKKASPIIQKQRKSTAHTPPDTHYYKYGQHLFPKLTFEESDREILEMLQDIFLGKQKKMA